MSKKQILPLPKTEKQHNSTMAYINPGILTAIILFVLCNTVYCWTLNDTQTLSDNLLQGYNKKLLPLLEQNRTVNINVSFTLAILQDFNDITGEISFLGVFQLLWHEERFKWDPKQYGGQTEIIFPVDDVWKPQLIMANVEDRKTHPGRNALRVRFYHTGEAYMQSLDYLQSVCAVDVHKYPLDVQTCDLGVAPWGYKRNEVNLIINDNKALKFEDILQENSAWELTKGHIFVGTDFDMSYFTISITFSRRPAYAIINLFLPVIVLTAINPLVFYLPPESGERVTYSVTIFLAMSVYMGIVSDHMPKGSEPIAEVSFWLLCKIVFSAGVVFCTIVSLRVYSKEDKEPVPKSVQVIVKTLHRRCFCTNKGKAIIIPTGTGTRHSSVAAINSHDKHINNPKRLSEDLHSVFEDDNLSLMSRDLKHNVKSTTMSEDTSGEDITWKKVGQTFDLYMIFLSLIFLAFAVLRCPCTIV